jgi:hypothetical protein
MMEFEFGRSLLQLTPRRASVSSVAFVVFLISSRTMLDPFMMLVACLAYSSTLKMRAARSSRNVGELTPNSTASHTRRHYPSFSLL